MPQIKIKRILQIAGFLIVLFALSAYVNYVAATKWHWQGFDIFDIPGEEREKYGFPLAFLYGPMATFNCDQYGNCIWSDSFYPTTIVALWLIDAVLWTGVIGGIIIAFITWHKKNKSTLTHP